MEIATCSGVLVEVKWEEEQSPNPGEYYLVGQAASGLCVYYAVDEGGSVNLEDADELPPGEHWPEPPAELVASAAKLAGDNDGLFPEDAADWLDEDDGMEDEDDRDVWDMDDEDVED